MLAVNHPVRGAVATCAAHRPARAYREAPNVRFRRLCAVALGPGAPSGGLVTGARRGHDVGGVDDADGGRKPGLQQWQVWSWRTAMPGATDSVRRRRARICRRRGASPGCAVVVGRHAPIPPRSTAAPACVVAAHRVVGAGCWRHWRLVRVGRSTPGERTIDRGRLHRHGCTDLDRGRRCVDLGAHPRQALVIDPSARPRKSGTTPIRSSRRGVGSGGRGLGAAVPALDNSSLVSRGARDHPQSPRCGC
jgi:hypothetical protein